MFLIAVCYLGATIVFIHYLILFTRPPPMPTIPPPPPPPPFLSLDQDIGEEGKDDKEEEPPIYAVGVRVKMRINGDKDLVRGRIQEITRRYVIVQSDYNRAETVHIPREVFDRSVVTTVPPLERHLEHAGITVESVRKSLGLSDINSSGGGSSSSNNQRRDNESEFINNMFTSSPSSSKSSNLLHLK